MSDPERIWLQNADDARATGDRLWCQDKVWPECEEQQEPTEYIRADLYASRISQQDAELERVRREVEEAKEFRAILEGHLSAAIDDYNDALKALEPFAEAAASYDPPENDDGHAAWAHDFTIGSLRRARAARQAQGGEE